jgi:hypothetical protein
MLLQRIVKITDTKAQQENYNWECNTFLNVCRTTPDVCMSLNYLHYAKLSTHD